MSVARWKLWVLFAAVIALAGTSTYFAVNRAPHYSFMIHADCKAPAQISLEQLRTWHDELRI